MSGLASLVLSWLVALAPLAATSRLHAEPVESMRARFESIAVDLAAVVEREPGVFVDPRATAALLVAIAFHESGSFHRSVDNGRRRGDRGESFCLMQLRVGTRAVYWGDAEMRTWRGVDLVRDRRKCFAAGLALLRESVRACSSLEGSDKLSGYTSGRCIAGEPAARRRWSTAMGLLGRKAGAS